MIKLIDILNEGVYDSMTKTVVRDIIKNWKDLYSGQPADLEFEEEYELEDAKGRYFNFEVSAVLRVRETKNEKYIVDGGVDQLDDPPYVEVRFQVDPRSLPQMWETIYYDLTDIIRHEIEHLTQEGPNVIPSKELESDELIRQLIQMKLLRKPEYFKLEKEVDAMLQGMYLKAKKTKQPFSKVLNDYFNKIRLSRKDREEILSIWSKRAKVLNLPPVI